MATGTGPCRSAPADQSHQSPDELSEDDLNVVLEALHPVAAKYLFLGVAMKVKMSEIEKIESQYSDPNKCLLKVLSVRLKQIPSLTWRDIDTALRSGPVGEVKLANRIRKQYGHLYPSSQASLDHTQGRSISKMTKNETKEEKEEMKYAQKQDIDEEVSESERYKKHSDKDSDSITNKAVVKGTLPKAKESPYTTRHSEPEKDYLREIQPDGKTRKATDDKGKSKSEVVDRHKVITGECSEQRAPQKAAKSESIASSSEGEAVTDDFETAEGTFSSEQEEEDLAEEHDIQQKKRSRRRHRESSMSPTARGSSSPSTSQEENRKKPESKVKLKPKGKGKSQRKKKASAKKTNNKEGLSSSTETDNSSPECDMLKNISETESKGLRKVFKRFFGRLCFTIKAPVELATRLQMKGLLTYSVMNELLTSPESEQAKSITLVKSLQKQIKSRPDRMFNIIDVFLGNEVLQQTGREIWTETGKNSVLINGGSEQILQNSTSMQEKFVLKDLPLYLAVNYLMEMKVIHDLLLSMGIINTISHSLAGNEVHASKTDVSLSSEAGDTSSASPALSPQEVSQSVPLSGISPVLAKYKKYLQSCYKARPLAPADKYLPTLESPYINLAMIRRGHYNHEQRNEFTRRTLHGGIDQILGNKTPINIENLLTPEDRDERYQLRVEGGEWLIHEGSESPISVSTDSLSDSEYSESPQRFHPLSETAEDISHTECMVSEYSEFPATQRAASQTAEGSKKPVRFILVEGPPGIGKSTFTWEVCRRWDEIENLRHYNTVVLLKLREKWVLNATSLSDLLRYPSHPDFSKSIAEELVKSQGEKLLLVLDGFDEVSHSFHEDSVIKSILCRQLLPECTIILTTRPVAKATLRSICQPRVDKHVEIIGFTEEERVRYITEVFSKEPELQVNFLKYMFLVPHIKSMMYIPLNCAIIAQVYYESQSSRHLAIPRTRTQLYKALTHSLLVRHMKMKESNYEYTCMLPEALDKDNIKRFKTLAKFAFDTYHKGESRKVTFFKEDIPEGLVHFGFMNESTEMYAGKGVERIFSFLHLSLQEYLAAWHLADSYSIEFQVAYHRLAADPPSPSFTLLMKSQQKRKEYYKGDNKEEDHKLAVDSGKRYRGVLIYKSEEEALISSLEKQRSSLVEPAIFLAGITGWRCQSEDDRNHWEIYLNDKVENRNASVLLQSLYEAQNHTLFPHYFNDSQRKFLIGSVKATTIPPVNECNPDPHTPYDCYALSYCLANSSDQLCSFLSFGFNKDNDIPLVETFVKGLNDHCLSTTPRVKHLEIKESSPSLVNRGLLWLMRANFLTTVEESVLDITIINNSGAQTFLSSLVNLQSLILDPPSVFSDDTSTAITSWEWLDGLKSLREIKVLHISSSEECIPPSTDIHSWLEHELIEGDNKLTEVVLDIKFPSNTIYDIPSPTDVLIDSVLKSVLRSNLITEIEMPNISRETMAGVHNILLHCPSLTILKLKRTRLGYDGIVSGACAKSSDY